MMTKSDGIVVMVHFTDHFYLRIQIWWALILNLIKPLLQNFAHDRTAMLSCHVQNFEVVLWLGIEYLTKFELWMEKSSKVFVGVYVQYPIQITV